MLVRKFDWTEERSSRALRALGNAATVIEPQRLPQVIEGDHAYNRVLECAAATSADTWSPATGGTCCPSRNIGESSTPPGSCLAG